MVPDQFVVAGQASKFSNPGKVGCDERKACLECPRRRIRGESRSIVPGPFVSVANLQERGRQNMTENEMCHGSVLSWLQLKIEETLIGQDKRTVRAILTIQEGIDDP